MNYIEMKKKGARKTTKCLSVGRRKAVEWRKNVDDLSRNENTKNGLSVYKIRQLEARKERSI